MVSATSCFLTKSLFKVASNSLTSPELVKKIPDRISGSKHMDMCSLTQCALFWGSVAAPGRVSLLTVTLAAEMEPLVTKDTTLTPLS